MNINMKYYIVTIGSIFLALGIGIIVGFNLNYDQELSKQQSEVLSQFEEKFDSLNEEKSDLNKQIDSLNEKMKTTVVLFYFNEMSIKEIAKITGSFEGTVKTRLFAATKL